MKIFEMVMSSTNMRVGRFFVYHILDKSECKLSSAYQFWGDVKDIVSYKLLSEGTIETIMCIQQVEEIIEGLEE